MEKGQRNTRKLSRAIQTCIADLVDTMPFNDSEIPDILISEGCITEDECKEIREKTNRKDQVRKLILLIKGRSFDTMIRFIDTLASHCPTTVDKVLKQYNIFLNKNMGPWKCPMCELKDCVDLKYVADVLYGKEIISTGLYSMICNSANPLGQQDYLWTSVLKACTGTNLKVLTDALKAKGHYNHIAESLSIYHKCMSNDASCLCNDIGTPPVHRKPETDETESSTTCSPGSTPFTSTVEDENTSPKTFYDDRKNNATDVGSEDSTAKTYSDIQSIVSEVTVVKANIEGYDGTIYDSSSDEEITVAPKVETRTFNTSVFTCFMCCRKKRAKQHNYAKLIN